METEKAVITSEPYEGMYDWSGSCAPLTARPSGGQQTFSVGIFQWTQKASGKGFKKRAVVRRIKGFIRSPREVYDRAQSLCDELNKELKVKP